MELSSREELTIAQADLPKAAVIWGFDGHLQEMKNLLKNKELSHEFPTDPFEDYQESIINSLNCMIRKKSY